MQSDLPQQSTELPPIVAIQYCVNNGVTAAVRETQPKAEHYRLKKDSRFRLSPVIKVIEQGYYVKWKPANRKQDHHYHQHADHAFPRTTRSYGEMVVKKEVTMKC